MSSDKPRTTLRLKDQGDTVTVQIIGEISDDTDFSSVVSISSPRLVFDLSKLERINSRGVVNWMALMDRLASGCESISIVHASSAFMAPFSMIEGMSGPAVVESIDAEYICGSCEETAKMTLVRSEHFPNGKFTGEPAPTCERCGIRMAPDHSYFDVQLPL